MLRPISAGLSAKRVARFTAFDSVIADPAPVTSPDAVNVANISVLHHHGELLALWEAGSPWQIDESSLDTQGAYEFSDETAGGSQRHPVAGLSSANALVLWHIDRNGKLQKVKSSTIWPRHQCPVVLVVDKNDFSSISAFEGITRLGR